VSDISEFDEKELAELLNEAISIGEHLKQAEDAGDQDARAEWRQQWVTFFKPLRGGPYESEVRRAYWEAST
jgi:hypothetical protein